MGEPDPLPDHMRPWFGDSWGHWEDDTLLVETTNIHPLQNYPTEPIGQLVAPGIWDVRPTVSLKVTERFTRVDEQTSRRSGASGQPKLVEAEPIAHSLVAFQEPPPKPPKSAIPAISSPSTVPSIVISMNCPSASTSMTHLTLSSVMVPSNSTVP
jgi:hypothetical protein